MNEEEVIERLKYINMAYDCNNYYSRYDLNCIETVLNLIQTQQAEISKLKNKNKELLRKLRNRAKEVKKLTRYSLYKKEFSTLNKQLQQKNKIIDLMGEKIFVEGIIWENKEDVKQYYERKVENGN